MESPQGTTVHEPEGELVPILVNSLGEPAVARWTPSDGQQIRYVIPDAVDWIIQRGLPAHAPAALRRVRSLHGIDACLGTRSARTRPKTRADADRFAGFDHFLRQRLLTSFDGIVRSRASQIVTSFEGTC